MTELQQFCAGSDEPRVYLRRPFTEGEHTYATNGIIAVRVAADPKYPPCDKSDLPIETIFARLDEARFGKVEIASAPSVPEDSKEECDDCSGTGKEHECPDCECECATCEGSGEVVKRAKVSTTIAGCTLNLRYALMMLALPGVEVDQNRKDGFPLLFRFDSGVGALMPLRGRYSQHVEIEPQPATAA